MITRITLTRFGKFAERAFELGACTLFYGKNEAGKTTVFDAMFKALCNPAGSTGPGKNLRERYGDDAAVVLTTASGQPRDRIDLGDFLGINAIRSGDVNLGDAAATRNWESSLKSRLFTAGVDLESIARDLDKDAADKLNYSHNRQIQKHRDELAAVEQELAQKRDERARLLAAEGAVKKLGGEVAELDRQIAAARQRHTELEATLRGKRKLQEHATLTRQLADLAELKAAEVEFGTLGAFDTDRLPEIDAKQSELMQAESAVTQARSRLDSSTATAEKLPAQVAELERKASAMRPLLDDAASAGRRAEAELQAQTVAASTTWDPRLLVVAGFLVAIGLAGLAALDGTTAFVSFGIALAAAVSCVALARKTTLAKDPTAELDLVASVVSEWNTVHREHQISAATLRDVQRSFNDLRVEGDTLNRNIQEKAAEKARLADEVSERQSELRECTQARDRAKDALNQLLREFGVASRDVYVEKRTRRDAAADRMKVARSRLPRELQDEEPGRAAVLVNTKLSALEVVPDASGEVSETELRSLETRVQRAEEEVERLVSDRTAKEKALAGESGHLKGRLGTLPADIVKLEAQILALQGQIDAAEFDKRAASLAAEIFREMSLDFGHQLAAIAGRVEAYLDVALGPGRTPALTGFADTQVTLTDAGGAPRTAPNLSRGTRDLVLLAARLAIAEQVKGAVPLLVLDEPFLSLDAERAVQALLAVAAYRKKNGWQVVMFTKDAGLRQAFVEVLGAEGLVHDL